jgi:hypothetical protein
MALTELACPTSVLSLFCRDEDAGVVVPAMKGRLPSAGVTRERLRSRFDLEGATYKLLDSRILEAAASALDQDVTAPLVTWLSTFQNIREAAAKTYAGTDEVLVTLREPTPLTSTQGSDVMLYVGSDEVATISFELALKVELGKTSVAVRQGRIEEVVFAAFRASASFTLEGYPKPLWKPNPLALPDFHLAVDPGFAVPLVRVPEPRESVPRPRWPTERPPVPGRRGAGS